MGNHFTIFPGAGSGQSEQVEMAPCMLAEGKKTAGTKCSPWRIFRKKTLHTNNRQLKKFNTMIERVNYTTVTFMKAEVVTQVFS